MKRTLKKIYRTGVALPASITGWPLIASDHISLEAAAEVENSKYHRDIFPVERFNRVTPQTLGEPLHWKFLPGALGTTESSEPVAATILSSAFLLGPAGTVINRQRKLVYDASLEICLTPDSHSVFNRTIYQKPRFLKGFTLNISASQAHENYFHWLTDALPKLNLAVASGHKIESFDHFVVSSRKHSFQKTTLRLLGIPENKIVALDEHPYLKCESVLITTATCMSGNVSSWILDFLRKSFVPANVENKTSSDIFIGRKNAVRRRLLNETELSQLLATHGFTTVYPESMSFEEQVALFANARRIVAAHGAGLTNIAFCSPGTHILELFPPSYINQGFWTMASLNKLDYTYLIGEGPEVPGNYDLLRNTDFTINVDNLIHAVQSAA
ncbi:MAG TPA: glycosyltransferase family 61 protein [Flavipsychrobacter sp.]|nr:glycosyltransferase family 61 protein [Flavipsychrobacter sp.]